MYTKNLLFFLCLLFTLLSTTSCKKFLDTKSDQSLSTPKSLDDLQAILDNYQTNNFGLRVANNSTDEYFLTFNDWQDLQEIDKNSYIWKSDLDDFEDWTIQYNAIFNANTVLYNLEKITNSENTVNSNVIKGAALFYRAHSHYLISQLYASQYDSSTASSDLGIPLRLTVNFNEASYRSTLQQSYNQIIADLVQAVHLLPTNTLVNTRPNKAAAYALLSSVYLQIGDYLEAKENADSCLELQSALIDFNTLDTASFYPFSDFRTNPEILFYVFTDHPVNANDSKAKIDSNLYNSYSTDDLRKSIYFRDNGNETYAFKGNYSGGYDLFNGLAIDEVYLIRAECNARLGKKEEAVTDINTLLEKRWKAGSFIPLIAADDKQALNLVLQERRKELIYRGTRWCDLRRLNKETKFAVTLKRDLNGQTYELAPNDLRYTLLIPIKVMSLSNLEQNPR